MDDAQLIPPPSVFPDTTTTIVLDPELEDFDPLPRTRLNADSRSGNLNADSRSGNQDQDPEPIARQRSNASDYSENPRASSLSSSVGVLKQSDDVTETPPSHEVTPPSHEGTPPAHEVTPPSHEGTPPAHEVTPPTHEVTPPSHEVTPPSHEGTPPAHEVTPPTHEVTPPAHEVTPPTHEVTPPAHFGTPLHLTVDLTTSPCGSTTSADDVKVIVEANDEIIQDTPLTPVTAPPTDLIGGTVNGNLEESIGSGNSEPEPGASLEPAVSRSNSLELRLEVPEDNPDDVTSDEDLRGTETDRRDLDSLEVNGIQEYPTEWYTEQKHVFIFSEAGKPIFSRHGKEENIVGLFGVMQALLSCVQDTRDDLHCIRTSDRLFVFRCHPPLILVSVSGVEESEDQLARQLRYVDNQAVFFLTQSHMARLFKNRQSYDLRHQMTGLPKFIKGIIKFVEEEHSFLLESIRCLAMPQSLRNEITSTLLSNRCPELVFALVLYERQIISIVRPKQYALTPQDLHLLMNYVQTGSTRGHGEKWTPACLPDFNDGGFLYIHDSYISESRNVSLVLITNEREQHLNMIKCKMRIVEQMTSQNTLGKLEVVLQAPFSCADSKIPDLRHFIYKSKSSQQIVSPEYTAPYNSDEDRKRLYLKYCHVYDKLHHSDSKLSIYFDVDSRESVVGYLMNNAEIYCTFSPYVTRPVALNNVDKLLKWIRREENRFFILGSGVY